MNRKLTESERSLIAIAFQIAAEKFNANATSIRLPQISKSFNEQSKQILELSEAFASADSIRLD